jgi:hypothetical protein
MALVTTFMTSPLLRLVYPDKVLAREIAEADRAATGEVPAYRVLVFVEEPAKVGALVDIATDLAATESPSQVVLTMFPLQKGVDLEIGAGLTIDLGEMASTLGELEVLAGRVRERGVDAVVLSRFSADPESDLLEQVETLDANVLLLPSDSPVATARGLSDVPVTVATFQGTTSGSDTPLSVLARSGQSGDSALALAVRWSRGRSSTLKVVDDGRRRVGALLERLGKAGVSAETAADVAGGVAVVAFDGTAPAEADAVLRVRAHAQQDDSELVLLLDALPAQTRREPGQEPVSSS